MIRFLLIISILFTASYAGAEKYFIRFGSFKNLKGLEKSINKLPSSLRSHVIIVRSNSWYIPFAYYTSNKSALYSKISKYKRYFPDAHIAHSSYMLKHPIVRNYAVKQKPKKQAPKRQYIPPVREYRQPVHYVQPKRVVTPAYQNVAISEEDNTRPIVVRAPIVQSAPIVESTPIIQTTYAIQAKEEKDVFANAEPKRYKNFSKKMLSGRHYYLAYKGSDENPNLLIKVTFGNHEVTYQPVMGDMQMTKANYLTEGDRLYMFANTFTRDGAYSKLEEHRGNHFLVSSWANGKKLNTLRYYYKLNDAKEYLGIDTSDGLAETLEEGAFDQFFLEDE